MSAKDIRNIVLLGHGGSGKTTLAESMLFMTGGTDRFGKVTDGNTTCDYDAEEIKRNISISLAVAPVKYKNVKINVLDTPGNFDFAGEVLSGIRAAECAVLVCGAKDGLSVGAERAWKMLGNKPRMIFINRTDEENSDYNACFDALKGKFGTAVAPIVAPIIDGSKKVTGIVDLLHNKAYEVKGGKAAECAIPADIADEVETLRAELMEAAAGADEELMEKFFETMELSAEEIAKGLKLGVRDGSVAPVLCGSAISGLGVDMLMQTVPNFERIGDYATNMVELAQRLQSENAAFSDMAKKELALITQAVNEILEITVDAFSKDDNEAAKAIEPLEETIDDMIMMLKDRHTKRLKNGQCSIASGLVFMEALTYFERASDQCSSIAVMMLARHNEQILQNHYEYLREIHAGNDVAYLAEKDRRREQYIKPLKQIF